LKNALARAVRSKTGPQESGTIPTRDSDAHVKRRSLRRWQIESAV
jgi:hypothetical protein